MNYQPQLVIAGFLNHHQYGVVFISNTWQFCCWGFWDGEFTRHLESQGKRSRLESPGKRTKTLPQHDPVINKKLIPNYTRGEKISSPINRSESKKNNLSNLQKNLRFWRKSHWVTWLGNPPHHLETQPHILQYDVLIGCSSKWLAISQAFFGTPSSKSLPSDSPPLDFVHVFPNSSQTPILSLHYLT